MQNLYLYEVEHNYLRFLHNIDSRVSVKYNNRPFVGIVTMINGLNYLIPLTSQTTKKREEKGKKKRSSKVTTFVRDSKGEEIANILHNNMIPIKEEWCNKLNINAEEDTYEANEIRFIRKNRERIIAKAQKIHDKRIEGNDRFLNYICCDFELLEDNYTKYIEQET